MVRNNNNFIYTFLSIVVVLFLVNRFLMPITMVLAIVLLYMMAHESNYKVVRCNCWNGYCIHGTFHIWRILCIGEQSLCSKRD